MPGRQRSVEQVDRRGSRDDSKEPEEEEEDNDDPRADGDGDGPDDEEEKRKWEELLALPPHGSEIFIGGLPHDVTEEDLRELCEPLGEICEVRLTKDKKTKEHFGFVHFAERASALKAVKGSEQYEIDGKVLEVSMAKPLADKKPDHSHRPGGGPNYPLPPYGGGYMGDPYGGIGVAAEPAAGGTGDDMNKEEGASDGPEDKGKGKWEELLVLLPHGSEIFIGGLPRDITEEDLRELCEPLGEIFEVRLTKDKKTKENKGFAFVTFAGKDAAQCAVEELQDREYKGRTLGCSLSQAKHRLFVGNVPKGLSEEELTNIIKGEGPGVVNIEIFKDQHDPNRNRGFLLVEYYNHACADYARQNLSSPNFKVYGSQLTVRWAEPKGSTDASSVASQVKTIYVKNLPENASKEKIKELFDKHGEITKIALSPAKVGHKRDFGFVHFAERASALKAVKESEKYEIDGQVLEVSMAKPLADKKPDHSDRPGGGPNYPLPPYGGGYMGDPYGAYGGVEVVVEPAAGVAGDDMDKEEGAGEGPEDDEEGKRKWEELLALPPHGSEVFIGGLPRDIAEEDLQELCEPSGEIFEVRLMKDKKTKESKGFAFVTFADKDAAQRAVEDVQDKEYQGGTLRCSLSQAKQRLFVGNVPKGLSEEELTNIIKGKGPGVVNIEMFKNQHDPNRNRGFLFVEYYNHACADYARKNLTTPNFKVDGSQLTVRWAEPKGSTDASSAASQRACAGRNENSTNGASRWSSRLRPATAWWNAASTPTSEGW